MIPGLTPSAEARLRSLLHPRITGVTAETLATLPCQILETGDPALVPLGIHASGSAPLTVVITDPGRPIGRLEISVQSAGCLLFLDNSAAEGGLHGHIRMLGPDGSALFPSLGAGMIALEIALLRSASQTLFWGAGATAVGCSIELEGAGRVAAIGDDALISSGVWIRNHDMHAIVDMRTRAIVNKSPVDTIIERHVWIGQNALLLNCARIGCGSIVGAQSLVKTKVGDCMAVGGVPARVLRTEVTWGRDTAGITEAELNAINGLPPACHSQAPKI